MNGRIVAAALITLVAALLATSATALRFELSLGNTTLCPTIDYANQVPYNYTITPLNDGQVTDAIFLTREKLLVAYDDGRIALVKIDPLTGSFETLSVYQPGLRVERFVFVREGLVAGIASLQQWPQQETIVVVFFEACGPECINIWGTYALDSPPVLIWYSLAPGLADDQRIAVLYNSRVDTEAAVHILRPRAPYNPNIVRQIETVAADTQVSKAVYVSWCKSVHIGLVYETQGGRIYYYTPRQAVIHANESYVDARSDSMLVANGTQMLAAGYSPQLGGLVVYALPSGSQTLHLYIVGIGGTVADVDTGLAAPDAVLHLDTSSVPTTPTPRTATPRAVLYYAQPAPMIRLYDFTDPSRPTLVWSLPLPGELVAMYPVEDCNPAHILVVAKDPQGMLHALLINATNGILMWDYVIGVRADQARALHFVLGWLIATDGTRIFLVNVASMLSELYVVEAGVKVDNAFVEYTAIFKCLQGECMKLRVLREGVYAVTGRSAKKIALPPGTYILTYQGALFPPIKEYFKILSRGECHAMPLRDPSLVAEVHTVMLGVCVVSAGDPQGWGLGVYPVEGARVVLHAVYGYEASNYTGPGGCTWLRVPPGVYNLLVSAYGFETLNETIIVNETLNGTVLHVKLTPIPTYYVFRVYAWDTREPLRNATIVVYDTVTGRRAVVEPFLRVGLPPGNYTVTASAPLYRQSRVKLIVEPSDKTLEKNLIIYLYPREFTVDLIVKLQMPPRKNATLQVNIRRISPIKTQFMALTETIPAGNTTVHVRLRLFWGVYEARIIAPLHQPQVVTIEVPRETSLTVNLSLVQYKLRVIAIDSVTRKPVKAMVTAETVGYRVTFPTGQYVSLPIGNYTLTISAEFYETTRKQLVLDHDVDMRVVLNPRLITVTVKALLGDKPLANHTVGVVGEAFNGVKVSRKVRLDNQGTAKVPLMPGNYTFETYYLARTPLFTLNLTASKRVTVTKPMTVELRIQGGPLLILLPLLPYTTILLAILISVIVLLVARRALRERLRKLREALAERLGGAPGELEEEFEI